MCCNITLYLFSTVVGIRSKFSVQVSSSSSGNGRSQARHNGSVRIRYQTILKDSRGQISGKGMRVSVELGGGSGNSQKASKDLEKRNKKLYM